MSMYVKYKSGSFRNGCIVAAGVCSFYIGLVLLSWSIIHVVYEYDSDEMSNYFSIAAFMSLLIWLIGWQVFGHVWRNAFVSRRKIFKMAITLALIGFWNAFVSVLTIALL